MKHSKLWNDCKNATNRTLATLNPRLSAIDDIVDTVYNDNLPKAMDEAAIAVFKRTTPPTDKQFVDDTNLIRASMIVLETSGKI